MDGLHFCVFGLGEAGSLLATDLLTAGGEVSAFDPAEVPTPDGVRRFVHPSLAVRRADVVLAVTAGTDAKLAMLQSLDAVRQDAVYADLSTGPPQLKIELAGYAGRRDLPFADVALMKMVPGHGLATPAVVSGTAADRVASVLNDAGGRVQAIDGPPGAAAAKKLLRSVMLKGVAAVLVEAVEAGAALDDLSWLWTNLVTEIDGADEVWMRRLVTGSATHARRRAAEMEAATAMLAELGVDPVMTGATARRLAGMIGDPPPDLPPPTIPQDLSSSSVFRPPE
ncbi:MAG: DUF1932 domain-containing protein [Actinomycetota bacterium]